MSDPGLSPSPTSVIDLNKQVRSLTHRLDNAGDGEKPTCRQCRSSRRPCTQRFNVRFSKRRAWNPAAANDAPSISPSLRPSTPVEPQQEKGLTQFEHQDVGTHGSRDHRGTQSGVEQPAEAASVNDQLPTLRRSSRLRECHPHQGSPHPSVNTPLQTFSSPPITSSHESTTVANFDAPTTGLGAETSTGITASLASHEAQLLQYFSMTLGGPW